MLDVKHPYFPAASSHFFFFLLDPDILSADCFKCPQYTLFS